MANEFKHKDPGTTLTQAEYISTSGDGHIFACQATGDILYASSATVLKNLGKGAANTVLHMGGSCIPAWTASPSVTDLTVGGGCITLSAATDIDLLDNNASALSFDASGKTGIITIVTTNCSEGVTMSGTLGVTGVVTANAGIVIDNVTYDACAITATAALTVDAATDIVLDADGDNITFKAGSGDSTGLDFSNSSGTWTVKAGTSDSDLIFQVNDGGTTNTVLTLDGGDSVVYLGGNATKAGELRILEDSCCGSNYVAIKAPAIGTSFTLTLPADDGCCGEVLKTNGSGVLDWTAMSAGVSLSGSTNNTVATVTGSNALAGEANLTFDGSTLTVTGDLTVTGGCIVITGAATDIDLIDNNSSALSLDASGKAGILEIVTTNCSEGVKMSGTLTVGVCDTGGDVKFFGASAGAFALWDESLDTLEIRGASADATTSTGKLLLSTSLNNINANDVIGSINFQAPLEAGGTDATAIAAGIRAVAQATFTCAVNATDLIFYTGHSEVATEKFRFTSQGEIGIGGANYGSNGQVLTSTGGGTAVEWTTGPSGACAASIANMELRAWDGNGSPVLNAYVSPGRMIQSPGVAKSWAMFQGNVTTPAEQASWNVEAIVDHGAGCYALDYITPMCGTAYVIFGMSNQNGSKMGSGPAGGTTGNVSFFNNCDSQVDTSNTMIIAFAEGLCND
tara:strand:- start:151 stop:2199 length:2049 start_codon:yes stop_codon:yes gene_type:complete